MPDPIRGALIETLQEVLPLLGWSNYSDTELLWERDQGNGMAEKILKARAILAAARRDPA